MKKTIALFACVITMFAMCSCGNEADYPNGVEYVPFQSKEDGRWGMVGVDGEILFEDEFKELPTLAVNGRFFLKNSEDLWDIYTAEKRPQLVSGGYKEIWYFVEDVTPAVKPNEPVKLINRNGEVVADLRTIAGKAVVSVDNFSCGLAIFKTDDDCYGAIDVDGNVVVEPEYVTLHRFSGGYAIGKHKKLRKQDNYAISIIDKNGDVTTISEEEVYKAGINDLEEFSTGNCIMDGYIYASRDTNPMDQHREYGLVNKKMEWVLEPQERIERISQIRAGHIIYRGHDDYYGLMDFGGEVIIREKYKWLGFAFKDALFAMDEDNKFYLLNMDGYKISADPYEGIRDLSEDYAIVEVDDEEYCFIDSQGKEKKIDGLRMHHVDFDALDFTIHSDYIDYDAIVNALQLNKDGIVGNNLNITPEQAGKVAVNNNNDTIDVSRLMHSRIIPYEKSFGRISGEVSFEFDRAVAEPIIGKAEEGCDSTDTFEETIGYKYSAANLSSIKVRFRETSRLEMDKLYDAILKKVLTLGKKVRENVNAVVVEVAPNRNLFVTYERNSTGLITVGISRGDTFNTDISYYGLNSNYSEVDSVSN